MPCSASRRHAPASWPRSSPRPPRRWPWPRPGAASPPPPIAARLTQPPADVSAMDGYALRAADGAAGRAASRHRRGAGRPSFRGHARPGRGGAHLHRQRRARGRRCDPAPGGRDREGERITSARRGAGPPYPPRRPGFRRGDGRDRRPGGASARAISGWPPPPTIPGSRCIARPRIAILATGDEIAMPGEPIPPGGIVSSNAHALAALVARRRRRAHACCRSRADDAGRRSATRGRRDARRWTCWSPPAAPASASTTWCAPGLQRARLRARFLEDRHAPGQAADVRPARRACRCSGCPATRSPRWSAPSCSCCPRSPACPACAARRRRPSRRALGAAAARQRSARRSSARASCSRDPDGRLVATPFPGAGLSLHAPARRSRRADPPRRPTRRPRQPGAIVAVIRLDALEAAFERPRRIRLTRLDGTGTLEACIRCRFVPRRRIRGWRHRQERISHAHPQAARTC